MEDYFSTIERKWSSAEGANSLNLSLIKRIEKQWGSIPAYRKIRVLSSILHLRSSLRVEASDSLLSILDKSEMDSHPWMSKMARLLRSFIATGSIDITDVDTETTFKVISALTNESGADGIPLTSRFVETPWESVVLTPTASYNIHADLEAIRALMPYKAATNVDKLVDWALDPPPRSAKSTKKD